MQIIGFILLGYLSGSILYARVFARLFGKEKMLERSRDKNPGTANAFMYGGFWCGLLTLLCDMGKGFLPVFFFFRTGGELRPSVLETSLVIAAPVVGHVFPLLYRFRGGKGIATTFGSLLGLFPVLKPSLILAVFFLFFSLILRVSPHFYRTLMAYVCALFYMSWKIEWQAVTIGFAVITLVICIRMLASTEEREKMKVNLLWMH